jgi:lipopolysaccharide biosynthesis protein
MAGTWELGGPDDLEADDVAVIASWSATPRASRSLQSLVGELRSGGFRVVVVSTCEADRPLAWEPGSAPDSVLRRPNVGYDFGSWSAALDLVPSLAERSTVLLCNDSLVGPFAPLDPILGSLRSSRADVWGLTASDQFFRHLQSFFVAFRGGVLGHHALRRFFGSVRPRPTKQDVILDYEIGLSRLLTREGFAMQAFLPSRLVVVPGRNPMIDGWRGVMELGVPFVKRELVRNPGLVEGAELIPSFVAERFGVDIQEWT